MESTTKNRTSQCREWERQRRNKFNDALNKLGDVVKEVNKSNDESSGLWENTPCPKVEIIQRAILCLSNCAQEKTHLKAEILALQVKLVEKSDKKDASTQVCIEVKLKKNKPNSKYVKLLMLQRNKRKILKEKSNSNTNISTSKPPVLITPKILPMPTTVTKKGTENTIVVLPAAPYLFPPRPVLFPTVPPAFVLVDPNMQTLNKTTVPTVNRNVGDVTKTTMVNILPISAYSLPLSANKNKKPSKGKGDVSKKTHKKSKLVANKTVKPISKKNISQSKPNTECAEKSITEESDKTSKPHTEISIESKNNKNVTQPVPVKTSDNSNAGKVCKTKEETVTESKNVDKATEKVKFIEIVPTSTLAATSNDKAYNNNEQCNLAQKEKKVSFEKDNMIEQEKDKENKLPNILETSICENVDTGNARLELAEEFLAASPTAAFLMSFPLVSGNRADSPAEEPPQPLPIVKDNILRRNENVTPQIPFSIKPNITDKQKITSKSVAQMAPSSKQNDQIKIPQSNVVSKPVESKHSSSVPVSTVPNELPFLNLPMSSFITTSCSLADSTFGLDFDCNINKSIVGQSATYAGNNNLFYKNDPFTSVKSSIYSTSNISTGHEFNSIALYPCAMEKYTTKTKSDYSSVEDNLMKIGSSRLTYDIDLGWSQKSLDFVSCTSNSNTFTKDSVLTTAPSYSASYNPFNPEFHVPLVPTSDKKETVISKTNTSFSDTFTSLYSQPTNLWSEDMPFYSNNVAKVTTNKHQNYLDHINLKPSNSKQYEQKQAIDTNVNNVLKPPVVPNVIQQSDKYTKKSPSKMHINWMTSELRTAHNTCEEIHTEAKHSHKSLFSQTENLPKKQVNTDSSYFPISMHNYSSHTNHEDYQTWPSVRPAGTTEISIEPPPANLPTLVGDLALGPHDKKKNMENRSANQGDIQNCHNFLSVTQLMNRSSDNIHSSRHHSSNVDASKSVPTKQNMTHISNDTMAKTISSRLESQLPQTCYLLNDSKISNSYDNMNQFSQTKSKPNKTEKAPKIQKNSYSAESLIRGGCTQKVQDHNPTKFMPSIQKYNDFSIQDSGVAQVSHFPTIKEYPDNTYTGQQFAGTTLYSSTSNTISNSFYSNLMPGSTNLMSGNYSSAPFSGDYIDYNQAAECNYSNHKYEEFKMRNNSSAYQHDKIPTNNYKSSRRESSAKHKLECSKKDSSKKYQSKRAKLTSDVEEWTDTSHLLWQNKPSKRHGNLMAEDIPYPNYMSNQMATQYQPELFNSHLMPPNMQTVGPNVEQSLSTFPGTSRANFNLSTIFPEITMKVQ